MAPSIGRAEIDPQRLSIIKTSKTRPMSRLEDLVFGKDFTDHMLLIEWNETDGWLDPKIEPYRDFSLSPASSVLHYGFQAFEGMKAFKDTHGRVRLFRPERNMQRLNRSAARIALPTFDCAKAVELIARYAALESRFVPQQRGYSLYLRPTIIGTQKSLGVHAPRSALFFVIASPVGPYFPSGFRSSITLEATHHAIRAWPGGVGDRKLGGNYAPCVVPQQQALNRGHAENLWLFGDEEYITEAGNMNVFVVLKSKDGGQRELITAPLDGTILEGATCDSVLQLARERLVLAQEGWKVSERRITMQEVVEASTEGRLLEVFGVGTATVVCPVRKIAYGPRLLDCGLAEDEESGEVARTLRNWLEDIQYGVTDHQWSFSIGLEN